MLKNDQNFAILEEVVNNFGRFDLINIIMMYKAELLQLTHTQFICLRNFVNKRIRNQKK